MKASSVMRVNCCTYLLIVKAKQEKANMPHETGIAEKPPIKPEWKMPEPQNIQRYKEAGSLYVVKFLEKSIFYFILNIHASTRIFPSLLPVLMSNFQLSPNEFFSFFFTSTYCLQRTKHT